MPSQLKHVLNKQSINPNPTFTITTKSSYELATMRAFSESLRNSKSIVKTGNSFKKADDSITGQNDG